MTNPAQIYVHDNCAPAYQLNWSLSTFWKSSPPNEKTWLKTLRQVTEPDGVRVLEHRQANELTSQFLLSSLPHVPPSQIIRSVKGRLQYLVREQLPSAFHRNYSMISVGNTQCNVVEKYVAGQLDHHPLADPNLAERFRQYQIWNSEIDLARTRRSNFGEFCHNLHLVFEYEAGTREVQHEALIHIRDVLNRSSRAKGRLLSRSGIVPDHLHLTVGCGISESPEEVALSYLNSLVDVYGRESVFKFSYYAGTFGPYDLGAIWNRQ